MVSLQGPHHTPGAGVPPWPRQAAAEMGPQSIQPRRHSVSWKGRPGGKTYRVRTGSTVG